jgi:hypothetical protein
MQNAKCNIQNAGRGAIALCILHFAFCIPLACQRREPLTAQKAGEIVHAYQFAKEPIYAEVPQRVWWSAKAPQDDYDVKALQTLRNLEHAGLVTIIELHDRDTTAFTAKVTPKGFPILGTAPSARGPCLRATICYKKYDGVRDFERHPTDPTIGHAELVWHYETPTPFYPLFETKINKPLNKPFASYISFYYKDFQWRFDVTVRKTDEL